MKGAVREIILGVIAIYLAGWVVPLLPQPKAEWPKEVAEHFHRHGNNWVLAQSAPSEERQTQEFDPWTVALLGIPGTEIWKPTVDQIILYFPWERTIRWAFNILFGIWFIRRTVKAFWLGIKNYDAEERKGQLDLPFPEPLWLLAIRDSNA
jgi:hypothetical protein